MSFTLQANSHFTFGSSFQLGIVLAFIGTGPATMGPFESLPKINRMFSHLLIDNVHSLHGAHSYSLFLLGKSSLPTAVELHSIRLKALLNRCQIFCIHILVDRFSQELSLQTRSKPEYLELDEGSLLCLTDCNNSL